jgi:5-methylcytosine-specific restriction endonuclease McrA
LLARDRGKCASCGVDIVQELREAGHIDHMFPIGRGGCNDVVNLQLLCSKCNLTKRDESSEVRNSVPRYIRRGTTKTPTSPAPGETRHGP